MKRIYAKEEVCIGCRLCEIHCVASQVGTRNLIKVFKADHPLPEPGVMVEEDKPISFALQCRHCDDAPCVEACLTGAMHRDPESGLVLQDKEKCVGCWMCVMVCPYGAIRRDLNEKKVASKCDLCFGRSEIPACVANCPNEALVYEEDQEEDSSQEE